MSHAEPAPEARITDESDRLKVQIQLLMQENAALRKQLAEANEKDVIAAGKQLIEHLANKLGLKLEEYEFRVDPQTGEMKFVLKKKQ